MADLSFTYCQRLYKHARIGKTALLRLGDHVLPELTARLQRRSLGLAQADLEAIAFRAFEAVAEKILWIEEWAQFLKYLGDTALSLARKLRERPKVLSSANERLDVEDPASTAVLDQAEAKDALNALLKQLSPKRQRQFDLHARHDLLGERMEDLAREEGVSLRTLKSLEKDLREYLRGRAERLGYETPSPRDREPKKRKRRRTGRKKGS